MDHRLRRPAAGHLGLLAAGLLCGGLMMALAKLALSLLRQDYSMAYVARVTERSAHGAYRLAGVWGGAEGSLLLWTSCTSVVGVVALVALARGRSPLLPAAAVVLCALVAALSAVVALISSPFERLAMPVVNGQGLAPVLEHPAMLVHPPLIHLALVCTTVPWALSLAAMWTGHLDAAWRRSTLRWAIAAWGLLTGGMALGAAWAYQELGWGGYWAWDPVENAALLPWLALTATIHLLHQPRADRAAAGAAMATFVLTGAGAVLARSGSARSVHAFADDQLTGRALLTIAAVVTAISLAAVLRHRRGRSRNSASRSVAAVVAAVAALVVAVGTFTPVIAPWFGGSSRVVLGHFYARLITPVAVVSLAAITARGSRRRWATSVGLAIAVIVGAVSAQWWPAVLIGAASAAAMATVGRRTPLAVGMAHGGLCLMMVAIGATALGEARTVRLTAGAEAVMVAGLPVELEAVELLDTNDRWRTVSTTVRVGQQRFTPELRIDTARARVSSESHLRSTWWRDVQVTLRDVTPTGAVTADVNVRPLAWGLWIGAALMALGAVLAWRYPRRTTRSPIRMPTQAAIAAGSHQPGTAGDDAERVTPVGSTA